VAITVGCGSLRVGTAEGSGWHLVGANSAGRAPVVRASATSLEIESAARNGYLLDAGRDAWEVTLPASDIDSLSISAFANAFQQALSLPESPGIANPPHNSGQSGVSQPLSAPLASDADIRTTLAISRDEAARGTTRTLNLPAGRRITVPIPSGIPDGQVIRLENQGDTASNGTTGALVLTISIVQDALAQPEQRGNENKTVLSDPDSPKKQMPPPNVTESRRIGTRFRRRNCGRIFPNHAWSPACR